MFLTDDTVNLGRRLSARTLDMNIPEAYIWDPKGYYIFGFSKTFG